ncbi:hypothetical protein AYL99_05398 [Fonsecaea erecta]|uniref:Uncharacterized protein n=1 Tax=Fonsecaea erecta TaxID=1367422 RepID=A0A178ZLX4_9EURO|nr:hypothetical protein AYL99_05398 [Fonsecaea erecta]OAP60396.1 hypothetical protein AYL99_05398 [Fonsecaea erecta]
MATSPPNFSDLLLTRVPPFQPDQDKSSSGLPQLAISRGSNALFFVTCLALFLLVSATEIFSYVTLALCLQLCPGIRERQQQSILQLISLRSSQHVLERLLEELSRTSSPYQPGCLTRLGEKRGELFGEPLKPLCISEERHHLTPPKDLWPQKGSRYHHYPCTPSRKPKPLKRGELGFLSRSGPARGSDPGPSPLPHNRPRPLLQQSSRLPQGSGSRIGHSSQRSIYKGHPLRQQLYPSQPYRAQLPTPLEAPRPPSVPTPPQDHLSQAAAPRTAIQTSSSAVGISPNIRRLSDQPTASPKQQDIHILPGLPLTGASEYLQPQRTGLGPISKSIQASFTAGVHLRTTTESLRRPDIEPEGITYAGGDTPKKRKRDTQSSSRPQYNASGVQNINENEESQDSSSEHDSESPDEDENPNPNPNEKTTSKSKGRGPFFRCPMYSAHPQRYDDTKCKHWHGSSIADVTRHSLKDAGEGSDKWKKIKKLSKAKLSPRERWKKYFVIFNDETQTDRMNYPYWVNGDAEDQVTDFLRSMMDQMKSDLNPTLGLMKVQQYYNMLMEKKQRDDVIRLQYQEDKTAAMRREVKDLETSRSQLTTQFEALVSPENPEAISSASMFPSESQCYALTGLTTPSVMPEVYVHNLDTQFPEAGPGFNPFMMQTGPPPICGDHYSTPQPLVNKVRSATVNTMVGGAHTTNTINDTLQSYDQQPHMLGPPQAYMPSDSGLGSSRRSAHRSISSANSTEDNGYSYSFNNGVRPIEDTSPFDFEAQNKFSRNPYLRQLGRH